MTHDGLNLKMTRDKPLSAYEWIVTVKDDNGINEYALGFIGMIGSNLATFYPSVKIKTHLHGISIDFLSEVVTFLAIAQREYLNDSNRSKTSS